MRRVIVWSLLGAILVILACITMSRMTTPPPGPVEQYPFDPSVKVGLLRADYDGDGELEIYGVRCERTRHGEGYTGSACMTPWTAWVTITENDGRTRLYEAVWCAEKPIQSYGWDENSGDLAVRTAGTWTRVRGTAPKGDYETLSGEIKRR